MKLQNEIINEFDYFIEIYEYVKVLKDLYLSYIDKIGSEEAVYKMLAQKIFYATSTPYTEGKSIDTCLNEIFYFDDSEVVSETKEYVSYWYEALETAVDTIKSMIADNK